MTSTAAEVPRSGNLHASVCPLVDQMIEEIRSAQLVGMQVYVSLGGRVLADGAVGWARGRQAMTPQSITHWLCCTKPLVALALAREVERGRVDVEDPVVRHVPEFGRCEKQAITIRQLLNHTSGIAGDPALEYMFCSPSRTLEAACQSELEPAWDPRSRARYVDFTTWVVLAEVVHRVGGESLARALSAAFFEPLRLSDSHLGMSTERHRAYGERVALLHVVGRPAPRECAFMNWRASAPYQWPAFGCRGPAFELGRIFESLLGRGGRLLSSETVDRFTTGCRGRIYDEAWDDCTDWGLGFITDPVFWGVGDEGTRAFGHTGLGSSFALAVPAWDLVFVCVGNAVNLPKLHRARIRRFVQLLVAGLRAEGELS